MLLMVKIWARLFSSSVWFKHILLAFSVKADSKQLFVIRQNTWDNCEYQAFEFQGGNIREISVEKKVGVCLLNSSDLKKKKLNMLVSWQIGHYFTKKV